MKKIIIIMLVLLTVGIVSAANITVHADTQIKLSYSYDHGFNWDLEDDNSIYVLVTPRFYELKIEWFAVGDNVWNIEYAHVDVWNMDDDIHLYYQFVTKDEPTNPINQ